VRADIVVAVSVRLETDQPDTVLLFGLHLECGKLINVYDFLMTFSEAIGAKRLGKNKVDTLVQASAAHLQYQASYICNTKPR
jgi:hypothetical protein